MLASAPVSAVSPAATAAAGHRRRSSAAAAARRPVSVHARGGPELEPSEPRRGGGGGFIAGVLLGGAVFGALGLLFAPQVSSLLLKGRDALRMPRGGEDERDEDSGESLEEQRSTLNAKIAQLNEAIEAFAQEADDAVLSTATHTANGASVDSRLELQLDVQRPGDVRTV